MITIDRNEAVTSPQAELSIPQQEIHLSEYWAVIVKRRRLILVLAIIAAIAEAVHTSMIPPTYRAATVLDIEREIPTPGDLSNNYSFDAELPTQIRLMTSRDMMMSAARRINQPTLPAFVAVNRIQGTNLVEISAVAPQAKLAADSANALAEAYIDWRAESKHEVQGETSQYLTAQIEQLKGEIERKEEQLAAYGRSKGLTSDDVSASGAIQNLSSNYASAVNDRVSKEARYRELVAGRDDLVAEGVNSPPVAQAKADQAKLERDYAEKLLVYKPEWPAMLQLKAQIDKLRQHVDVVTHEAASRARDLARADYLTALRKEETFRSVVQRGKSAATDGDAVEYNNLKVEIDTKRALLDTLVKRSAETQVSSRPKGSRLSNIRIVDRAEPPGRPSQPSYKGNILVGLLIGLGAGIALAFFLEYLDRSLRTGEQVERALRLPALGIIPSVGSARRAYGYGYGYGGGPRDRRTKKPSKLIATAPDQRLAIELFPHEHARSSVAEAYRAFRTSLLLSRAGGVKTIAITSSNPAEGKTATAVNLGIVLAQLGRRVLLVDADLHKPRLHEVLHVSNRIGLVSILAENVPPGDAILKTTVPNVFVIPSGPSSPNPSGLLSSQTMRSFLEFVAASFDHIIIDTPPVSLIADALMIGSVIDGVVITIRGGKTPREHVTRVRDRMLRANVRILGALINDLEEEKPESGNYYAYYGEQERRPPTVSAATSATTSRSA